MADSFVQTNTYLCPGCKNRNLMGLRLTGSGCQAAIIAPFPFPFVQLQPEDRTN